MKKRWHVVCPRNEYLGEQHTKIMKMAQLRSLSSTDNPNCAMKIQCQTESFKSDN
jgi:hypothetical protein